MNKKGLTSHQPPRTPKHADHKRLQTTKITIITIEERTHINLRTHSFSVSAATFLLLTTVAVVSCILVVRRCRLLVVAPVAVLYFGSRSRFGFRIFLFASKMAGMKTEENKCWYLGLNFDFDLDFCFKNGGNGN